jgi:hypothetical protein
MTRVFVSYSTKDKYFVDFLVELLKFHHVDVWVDRNELHGGTAFSSGIDHALTSCDFLIVVISQNSADSQWMTREISTFRTANPDRRVIPLALVEDADVEKIYGGLGQIQKIRCYESWLEGFRELLRLLDRTLFPPVERRSSTDRRSEDRRQGSRQAGVVDRRVGPIERRLRVGMKKGYSQAGGRGEFEPLWAHDVGNFVHFLSSPASPLLSFDFVDRQTSESVYPDFRTLEIMAFKSWESNDEKGLRAIVYIIDDLVRELTRLYTITPKDRREAERRTEGRRSGERRSADEQI